MAIQFTWLTPGGATTKKYSKCSKWLLFVTMAIEKWRQTSRNFVLPKSRFIYRQQNNKRSPHYTRSYSDLNINNPFQNLTFEQFLKPSFSVWSKSHFQNYQNSIFEKDRLDQSHCIFVTWEYFRNFLPLRFSVKPILGILEVQNLPLQHIQRL